MPNPFQRHDSEFTLRSVFNLEGSLTSLLADVFPTVYLLCNTGVPVRHAAVLSAPLGTKKKKLMAATCPFWPRHFCMDQAKDGRPGLGLTLDNVLQLSLLHEQQER